MLTLHLPRKFEHISQALKSTDPTAWIVLGIAGGLLITIVAASFFR